MTTPFTQKHSKADNGSLSDEEMNIAQELNGADINSLPDEDLTPQEKVILTLIQSQFPMEARPYAVMGKTVGLSEQEVFTTVQDLKKRKIIRRIGANFQSRKLGFHSTLCAAKVPENIFDAFVEEVNSHVGVTHNYLRNHAYNVWFTCIGPSQKAVHEVLQSITQKTGIAILNLPAKTMYKIKVDFKLS